MNHLVEASLVIEKLRVASQVRQSHLALNNRADAETDELLKRIVDLESYVDKRVAKLVVGHPAYPWFSRVKGVGKENIGKIVYAIRVKPEADDDGNAKPYADSISALWKFAGYSVEDGKAPKRTKDGGKLCYNSRLRSMCWRLGGSLMKAKGVFYEYYAREKQKYAAKYEGLGVKIVPAAELPKVDGKKQEGNGYISEGHLHNQALRKMIKLFLACLWLEWRKAEGLPLSNPYVIDKLGHNSMISPEDMVDREASSTE